MGHRRSGDPVGVPERTSSSAAVGGVGLIALLWLLISGSAWAATGDGAAPGPQPSAAEGEQLQVPDATSEQQAQSKRAEKGGGPPGDEQPQEPVEPDPDPKPDKNKPAAAKLKLDIHGLKGGRIPVGRRIKAIGRIDPFVPGQKVLVKLKRRGKTIKSQRVRIKPAKRGKGRFTMRSQKLIKPGGYRFVVTKKASGKQKGGRAESKKSRIEYPDLRRGQRSSSVKLLRKLLKKQGYYVKSGSGYDSRTERAILAFRKVNGMSWKGDATPGIFKRLAAGKGGFKPRDPGAGHHVEVDFSRQVMALISKRKVRATFHISSGAPATPSDFGRFRFYRKEPGLNSIGMYYSVYYNRGEATHGYHSVPLYPASHGCIRNPIPDSKFIYNWIDIGDLMYVYR